MPVLNVLDELPDIDGLEASQLNCVKALDVMVVGRCAINTKMLAYLRDDASHRWARVVGNATVAVLLNEPLENPFNFYSL